MKRFTAAIAACVLISAATAKAQERFGYRPNFTAQRQGIARRMPTYSEYYRQNHGENPPYSTHYRRTPSSDYRHTGGISDRYGWMPIYQFYNPINGDQMLTARIQNEDPYALQQYASDGMFFVAQTGGAGRIPLYRYWEPNSYHSFTTFHDGMQDAHLEGILGYIETRQTGGTVPLYGWYDPYLDRYMVTTNPNSQLRYNFEYLGVLGYVMPG